MNKNQQQDERAAIEAQIPADFRMMLPHRTGDVVDRVMKGEAIFQVVVEIREEERKARTAARKGENAEPTSSTSGSAASKKTSGRPRKDKTNGSSSSEAPATLATDADAPSSDVEP